MGTTMNGLFYLILNEESIYLSICISIYVSIWPVNILSQKFQGVCCFIAEIKHSQKVIQQIVNEEEKEEEDLEK